MIDLPPVEVQAVEKVTMLCWIPRNKKNVIMMISKDGKKGHNV